MVNLEATAELLKLFGDPTRVRLLHLLSKEELTVSELTRATRLVQSRVSTHLGRLKDAGLVRERRNGNATYHSLVEADMPPPARRVWALLDGGVRDQLLAEDQERLRGVLSARGRTWADGVAGSMERHYSPGRTWESAARGLLGLATLGHVLDVASGDGALAELVAPRACSVTCIDRSPRVLAAGKRRGVRVDNLRFVGGDMHALPFPAASFDQLLFMNALSYSHTPALAVREAARVLRPGGELTAVALKQHRHRDAAAAYDHVQPGFDPGELRALLEDAGLHVSFAEVTSRERRAPHFEILTLYARRAGAPPHA